MKVILKGYLLKMAMFEPEWTMETEHDKELLIKLIQECPAFEIENIPEKKDLT